MKNNKNKGFLKEFSFFELINFICMSVILIFIPLIVRHYGRMPTDDELLIRTNNPLWDHFSYYKSGWLIVFGAIIIFILISGIVVGEVKITLKKLKDPVLIAACIYCLFVVLSSIFSEYKQTSVRGVTERYEGVFVLIMYMVVLLTVKSFAKDEKKASIFLYIFLISALLIGTIGTFQTIGLDIFKTDLGKRIVLGSYYGAVDISVGYNKTYSTLYNPNCAGLYAAFLTPVFFYTGLFINKKKPLKYICFLACLLMLVCLYGSESVAGYIGFFTAVVVSVTILSIYTAKFGERKLLFFISTAAVIAAASILVFVNFDKVKSVIIRNFNIDGSKYTSFIKDLKIQGNRAEIITANGSFIVSTADNGFELLDMVNHAITPDSVTNEETYIKYLYSIEQIGQVEVRAVSNVCSVKVREIGFLFSIMENGDLTALLMNNFKAVDLNQKIPSVGFKGMEQLATGRGFIWSRSIPLLRNNLILGGGPDTFAYQFPQHDLAGKIRAFGNLYTVVDKPHNTFLQIGINTGLISLLSVMFIFGFYIITSFKEILLKKAENKFIFGLSVGLLTGVCAYLVCSLSTDSTVSVSPIFYAGLGFGLAITQISKGLNSRGK